MGSACIERATGKITQWSDDDLDFAPDAEHQNVVLSAAQHVALSTQNADVFWYADGSVTTVPRLVPVFVIGTPHPRVAALPPADMAHLGLDVILQGPTAAAADRYFLCLQVGNKPTWVEK